MKILTIMKYEGKRTVGCNGVCVWLGLPCRMNHANQNREFNQLLRQFFHRHESDATLQKTSHKIPTRIRQHQVRSRPQSNAGSPLGGMPTESLNVDSITLNSDLLVFHLVALGIHPSCPCAKAS